MNSPFKSPWHFDKFREDKEGEYVKIVGRFMGDFSRELTMLRTRSQPISAQKIIISKATITPPIQQVKTTKKKISQTHTANQMRRFLVILSSLGTKTSCQ